MIKLKYLALTLVASTFLLPPLTFGDENTTDNVVTEKQVQPEITGINWVVVFSDDSEKTAAFFQDKLELDLDFDDHGLFVFRLPSGQAFDIYGTRPEGISSRMAFGFGVGDLALDKQRAQALGVEFDDALGGRMEGVAAWEFFQDPDGYDVQLSVSLADAEPGEKQFDQSGKALKVKGIRWVGLSTENLTRSNDFYQNAFGAGDYTVAGTKSYSLMQYDDGTFLNVSQMGSEVAMPANHVIAGFEVDDLAGSLDILKNRGIDLVGGTSSQDGFIWQHFQGPEGLIFRLVTQDRE